MYQYNLIISNFSNDEKLEKAISKHKKIENISFNITRYEKISKEQISNSDIVIIDIPYDKLDSLKEKCKKFAKVILCVDAYSKEYDIADGIILKPFDYDYVKYYFNKVLDNIKLEEDLRYTNNCLNTAIDGIPDMIWVKSLDGIHTLLNNEFCNVVDKTKEDVTGKDHYYIWGVSKNDPNSGADICKQTEDEVIKAGKTLRFNECVKNKKGKRQLVTYKSPLYDRDGKVIGTIGFGHDVTDMTNMSIENEIFLNSVPYAVLLRDSDGNIQIVNNCFETYFNVSKEKIIGTSYDEWVTKTFYPDRVVNGEGFIEGTTYKINGAEKQIELRFDNVCDVFENVTGQVYIFRDVTLERQLEAQILQNSNIDFMTKLYNRRYLDKFISLQKEGEEISLFSVDLDHFKAVNDTFGHKKGDEAIILTANTIKKTFPNDISVRMGGDEFLIVRMGKCSIKELEHEAKELLNNLNNNFKEIKEFNLLSASIGIARGELQYKKFDKLLQQSDKALYEAKESGRARYCFYK